MVSVKRRIEKGSFRRRKFDGGVLVLDYMASCWNRWVNLEIDGRICKVDEHEDHWVSEKRIIAVVRGIWNYDR